MWSKAREHLTFQGQRHSRRSLSLLSVNAKPDTECVALMLTRNFQLLKLISVNTTLLRGQLILFHHVEPSAVKETSPRIIQCRCQAGRNLRRPSQRERRCPSQSGPGTGVQIHTRKQPDRGTDPESSAQVISRSMQWTKGRPGRLFDRVDRSPRAGVFGPAA